MYVITWGVARRDDKLRAIVCINACNIDDDDHENDEDNDDDDDDDGGGGGDGQSNYKIGLRMQEPLQKCTKNVRGRVVMKPKNQTCAYNLKRDKNVRTGRNNLKMH